MVEPAKAFSTFQLDALKELGNVGAGNAATALSQLVGRRVDLSVCRVTVIGTDSMADFVGDKNQDVAAVYLPVHGEVNGKVLILFSLDKLASMVKLMLGPEPADVLKLTDLEQSAVKEMGSILTGAYLNALFGMLHLHMVHGVPALALDRSDAVLESALIDSEQNDNLAIVIETEFLDDGKRITGDFLFIPEAQTLPRLLQSFYKVLGIPADA